eukprot:gene18574-biopygen8410
MQGVGCSQHRESMRCWGPLRCLLPVCCLQCWPALLPGIGETPHAHPATQVCDTGRSKRENMTGRRKVEQEEVQASTASSTLEAGNAEGPSTACFRDAGYTLHLALLRCSENTNFSGT